MASAEIPFDANPSVRPAAPYGFEPPAVYEGRGVGGSAARGGGGGGATATRTGEGVQINFDQADIREVVKVILGDVLKSPYTIADGVSGQVTLSSAAPLSDRDLLSVLESVLQANGATLVQQGGRFDIQPLDKAVGPSEVVPVGGRPVRVRPGYGITVVPLRHISATSAAQFLQPLITSPEDIRIDQARNLVLFSGNSSERQSVVDMLADVDVDWLAGKSVGIFPLRVTTPEAVIPELQSIFAPYDPNAGEASPVRFMPISRLNAVLAVGNDGAQIREVGQWLERLDRGESTEVQFYVYYLKHAVADDLARVMNAAFGSGEAGTSTESSTNAAASALGATAPGDNTDLAQQQQDQTEEGAPGTGPGLQSPLPQANKPPGTADFGQATAATPWGPVKIVPSRTNNALLIRAAPQAYQIIEAMLRRLDVAPYQVLIEATIAEIVLNDALRYGVQYFLEANGFKIGFNSTSQGNGSANIEPSPTIPGFNLLYTGGSANITIDALSRITDVRVLSSPSVVVEDNREAVLTVGDEVPITTQQQQSLATDNANILNSIEYRNTGVILQVRPRINVNGVVSLEIGQEVSRVDRSSVTAENPLTPTITQRKITSRVKVDSGQTVALGGLIQDSEERSSSRVPILGDIPVLGPMFGTTSNINQRTELIVFITPRVIRNADDARDISEELRSKLQGLRPVDGDGPAEEPYWRRPEPYLPPDLQTVPPVTAPPPGPTRLLPQARGQVGAAAGAG